MKAATVPKGAKQGAETLGIRGWKPRFFPERRVSALVNGVEGGKWYSLMDKVYAPKTLALAPDQVRGRLCERCYGSRKSALALADQQRWNNADFAAAGLFALYPVWQTERHPR
ncbi:MAG: hypothetical protein AB1648_00120 [Pseudomonadota bacterium]